MRIAVIAAVIALAAPVLAAGESPTVRAQIEQLKAGATGVDLRALRLAMAAEPGFVAADWAGYGDAGTALAAHRDADALKLAQARLDQNYLDVRAQMVAAEALARLGRKPEADRHQALAQGLLEAIASGGDGNSAATAWTVISVDEEYALLEVLGLRTKLQSLVPRDGHKFDVLDVVDPNDPAAASREIWFNIDLVFGHEL